MNLFRSLKLKKKEDAFFCLNLSKDDYCAPIFYYSLSDKVRAIKPLFCSLSFFFFQEMSLILIFLATEQENIAKTLSSSTDFEISIEKD